MAKWPKFATYLPAAAAVSLVLAACGSDDSGTQASIDGPESCDPTEGGELVLAYSEDLPTFDPANNPIVGPTAFSATPLVFDRLLSPSPDLKSTEPDLATSVEPNQDFTKWTIEIRDGVKFHDGSKLDADDVVFSLNYNLEGFNGYALGPVSKITKTGPLTVEVEMDSPYADLPTEGLSSWLTGFVFPDDFGGQSPEDFFRQPVGTGPFSVTSYKPGTGVEFARNNDYWREGRPYVDSISLRIVPEANDRVLGLESGDFDFIDKVPADQVDNLPEGSIARVIEPTAQTEDLFLGKQQPLWRDKKVRQAVSLALNREEIVDGAYAGFAQPGETLVPVALPDVTAPDPNPYTYDLDRAKQLMAESSFPDGGTAELTYIRGDANTELEVQLIQEDLSKIGIDVKPNPVGAGEYLDLALQGNRTFTLFQNIAVSPDPIDFLSYYASSDGYYGGWPVAPVNRIIEQLQATDDPARRSELLADYETFTVDLSAQIPVLSALTLNAQSSDVSGPRHRPPRRGGFHRRLEVRLRRCRRRRRRVVLEAPAVADCALRFS